MSYEIPSFYVGVFPADVDMSVEATWQYTGVCVKAAAATQGTGAGGAALVSPSAIAVPIIGILQNNPQLGEAGQVMVAGVSKAVASGVLAIGDLLKVDSAGKFLKATTGTYAVAVALEVAAIGDVTTVLLMRNGIQ